MNLWRFIPTTAQSNVSPVTVSRRAESVSSTHALGPQSISERRHPTLPHLQLLPPATFSDETRRGADVRTSSRRSTSEMRRVAHPVNLLIQINLHERVAHPALFWRGGAFRLFNDETQGRSPTQFTSLRGWPTFP